MTGDLLTDIRVPLGSQSVQRVADDMVEAGLVAREPSPDHQRSPLMALTDEGRAMLEELFRRSNATPAALLDRAGVSVADLEEARWVIQSLLVAFDE